MTHAHGLQQASTAFLSQPQPLPPAAVKQVQVLQGEFALIDLRKERPDDIYVCSGEATTCCIVVLRCLQSRRVFISHVDQPSVQAEDAVYEGLAHMTAVCFSDSL